MQKRNIIILIVIIIVALGVVMPLIATKITMKTVESARDSARKNNIAGYADELKLQVLQAILENDGEYPIVDKDWAQKNVKKYPNIDCEEIYHTEKYGVVLHNCTVDGQGQYYYAKGIYDQQQGDYQVIYNEVKNTK